MQLTPQREVIETDAIAWLGTQATMPDVSVLGSLPDKTEFPELSLSQWREWFIHAARLALLATPPAGATFFYQTDTRCEGAWIDKAYLCQKAAEELGVPLIWHKIVPRLPPGQAAQGRPGYTHLLCFSRRRDLPSNWLAPDILAHAGKKVWARGMGIEAARLICRYMVEQNLGSTLVNPFSGWGTALVVANNFGLHALGIEKSRKRAEKSRLLRLTPEGKFFFGTPC